MFKIESVKESKEDKLETIHYRAYRNLKMDWDYNTHCVTNDYVPFHYEYFYDQVISLGKVNKIYIDFLRSQNASDLGQYSINLRDKEIIELRDNYKVMLRAPNGVYLEIHLKEVCK